VLHGADACSCLHSLLSWRFVFCVFCYLAWPFCRCARINLFGSLVCASAVRCSAVCSSFLPASMVAVHLMFILSSVLCSCALAGSLVSCRFGFLSFLDLALSMLLSFHVSGPWRSSYRNQTHRTKSIDYMYMYIGNDQEGRSTTQRE
jgi:hypothetical protein